jgi:hypothetical protein
MGARHNGWGPAIGLTLALLMLLIAPAASAFASAKVRLINARSGDSVGLKVVVGGATPPDIGPAAYGQATPYANVDAGNARISLSGLPSGASASTAQTTHELTDGRRYTAVAIPLGSKNYGLIFLRDGSAKSKTARLRVIHAAPELGSPDIRLGQRTIAEKVAYKDSTPYLSIDPGSYELIAARPGDGAIFSDQISLSAGASTTAVIAGTGGTSPRIIVAADDTRTPAGAPETGFGGLASGDDGAGRWLLVLVAALLAGAVGGVTQLSLARRRRP